MPAVQNKSGSESKIFDENRPEYADDLAESRELLTESEYWAANRAVINAHYTDPALATEIWKTLQGLSTNQLRADLCVLVVNLVA